MGPTWTAALTALPKVELCVRLEGTMRADTVSELARKNGVPPAGLGGGTGAAQSVLRTRQDWALLSYESTLDAAASGVAYREVSFSPAVHLVGGGALGDIVAGIDDGLTAGERETGVVTRTICDIDRVFGPAAALEQVSLLQRLKRERSHGSERVIGVGMVGPDPDGDPCEFAPVFDVARHAGLHRTAQVGVRSATSIAVALDALRCERIDQGIAVLGDPALVTRMARERIPLNLTPSDHLAVDDAAPGGEAVLTRLRAAGLLVTLTSSEPASTGMTLGEEYRTVARALSLDWDEMVALALAGVEAAWLADDDRSRLMARIEHAADSLRPAA